MTEQRTAHKTAAVDELSVLLAIFPPSIADRLREEGDLSQLLEVILDLGRIPTARFLAREVLLGEQDISEADLEQVAQNIGAFGQDNRAGIERTLHRISAIRNRRGKTVGLTCRVGRAVYGSIAIIDDLVRSGKSILLLGRPGVGKTTMLREVARVLADDLRKRVVVVDTSNEIAGDGDIPHPGIGRSRRMQVAAPALQHEVMIEAVENHMPEVIIIDEIGRELETQAARTIAERGVQLVATAHGNTLENLMQNPTLADLIGGIQAVTLGDEEARRRGTQKTILERKAPPTFDCVVEIQGWNRVAVHPDVARTVDSKLRGRAALPETRTIDAAGAVHQETPAQPAEPERPTPHRRGDVTPLHRGAAPPPGEPLASGKGRLKVFPYGVNRGRSEQVVRSAGLPVEIVSEPRGADAVMTTKAHYRNRPQPIAYAESSAIPVYVLRKNTAPQIEQCLLTIAQSRMPGRPMDTAVEEAEQAARTITDGQQETVDLAPQTSYIRRLQHQVAEQHAVASRSSGRDPHRRVRFFRT
ncbi:MAG: AAA family ATPase [Dehalococcoidia bacterium]|nr:AAA family ATPase [Dehalococcoidia bacterium]